MLTKIYDVAFEIDGDSIELEQDCGIGEVASITLHRIHLRHLAEQAGLILASAHQNPDAAIARLTRQLRTLQARIKHLDECLWAVASAGREDLDHETTYSLATLELADEFIADLDPVVQGHAASRDVTSSHASITRDSDVATLDSSVISDPENGTVRKTNAPESGTVSPANGPKSGGIQADLLSAVDGKADGTAMAIATQEGATT
ncbi:hypothetical protein HHL11_07110 [Ramlibacter sp. G-1-2-2]|uniref:Uncharacterized protein n=1 Tax=Ramlibacter agri TaxID=2728837 RepID=A0A848H1Q9_9BURK|nr:hypothetical protein [Ramlibacter agri]NML43511.1 hypothetical protein [Ramlibacter agri]